MNPLIRAFKAAAAFTMRWATRTRWGAAWLGSTVYDYVSAAGDGRGNAAVMACVKWIQRALPEAPAEVIVLDRGDWTPQPDHPLQLLLHQPNRYYSGLHLWAATVADFTLTGNAYWLKVRSGANRVVELWWVPSTMLEPHWPEDGSAFLDYYAYRVDGREEKIDPSHVVHFRDGFDPDNTRKGLSPLASLAREIATDNEAANWTGSLLRNAGIPGVVIAPDKDARPRQDELEEVKQKFVQRFTGDHRGEPLVMRGATTVTQIGFNPEQMNLRGLRRIPEERISALFGIPAAVVGLGVGLEQTKVGATLGEMREQAYESCLIPLQRLLAAEINAQLVPDFGQQGRLRMRFDLSQVRVLQADMNELHARVREDLKAGLITRSRALEMIGEDPGDGADVLYLPINVTPTDPAELLAPAAVETLPALPAPGKVRALPVGKQARKADDGERIAASIQRLRDRLQTRTERAVATFLAQQAGRVVDRLNASQKAIADVPDAGDLLPEEESELLRAVLEPAYLAALDGVHGLTEDVLGVSFALDDTVTRRFLADAGQNIVGINQTTRDAVRAALIAGQAEGESLSQLAKRLRALPEFGRARAQMIARTELAQASNRGALESYESSGVVVGITVVDGDYDAECAAMNGRRFTLRDARGVAPLQHPACKRALIPLTEVSQLEDAA